jgi:hypothetical protein
MTEPPDDPLRWARDSVEEDFELHRALELGKLHREYEQPLDVGGVPVDEHRGHHVKRLPDGLPEFDLPRGWYCDACLHPVPLLAGKPRRDKLRRVGRWRVCGECAHNAPELLDRWCPLPIEYRRWHMLMAHKIDPLTGKQETGAAIEYYGVVFDDAGAVAGYVLEATCTDLPCPLSPCYWSAKRRRPGATGA